MSSAKGRLFNLGLNELSVLGHQQTECWLWIYRPYALTLLVLYLKYSQTTVNTMAADAQTPGVARTSVATIRWYPAKRALSAMCKHGG